MAAIFAALAGHGAWAQATPTVKIVVPYPPGSGPDILSRLMADEIGRAKGPTMVVENRPGGGTVIGTEAAARAAPDGGTILLVANSFVINPALRKQNYDPSTSFEPICYLAATPLVLVVNASSPYRTLADLIGAARAKPGELVRERRAGVLPAHRHRGAQARGRHQRDLRALCRHGARDQRAAGRPRDRGLCGLSDGGVAVAVGHAARAGHHVASAGRGAADVPTFAETGIASYEADIFYGYVAPAKTPAEMLSQLSGWFSAALKAPETKPKLAKQGLFPVRHMRRGIRRLHAKAGRRIQPHHSRIEYQG